MLSGLLLMSVFSCAGRPPESLGIHQGRLAPCPDKPNCVSSDATTATQRVDPFHLARPPDLAWAAVIQTVLSLPRTKVVSQTGTYMHAECRSAVFGFVDDLELQLHPDHNLIAVRSAARLGHSDFGVNRKRIESLRHMLQRSGLIE